MDKNFLSFKKIIRAKISTIFSIGKLLSNEYKNKGLTGYTLVKDLTPKESMQKGRVGIYLDSSKKKVIIKKHNFLAKDIDYLYLCNEAGVLDLLDSLDVKNHIEVPKLVELIERNKRVYLITQLKSGQTIETISASEKLSILKQCLAYLKDTSEKLVGKKNIKLMKKNTPFFLTSFPIYIIRCVILNPGHIKYFASLIIQFYASYLKSGVLNQTWALAHCELYPDSILYNQKTKKITLIDWEAAILSDKLYDLALISRYYFSSIKPQLINKLIFSYVENKKTLNRFKSLCIFSCIESISRTAEFELASDMADYIDFVTSLNFRSK